MLISSGKRHKFTSLFSCASLVHPCTSVAYCLTKFQVSLTALITHLHFAEPCSNSFKYRKDSPDNKIYPFTIACYLLIVMVAQSFLFLKLNFSKVKKSTFFKITVRICYSKKVDYIQISQKFSLITTELSLHQTYNLNSLHISPDKYDEKSR